MKKTTKLFILALVVTALVFTVSIEAFAYEVAEADNASESLDSGIANTEDTITEKTFFDTLFSAFESNAAEILSALAFLGSIIIMFCYKKGLTPIINDGLKALKSGIKSIGEKSETFNEHAIGVCDSIDSRLAHAEKLSEAVLKSAEEIEDQLCEIRKSGAENEKLKLILSAQIDMMYEIFMSAALPQYLKDSVGDRIGKMRSELGKEVQNESVV